MCKWSTQPSILTVGTGSGGGGAAIALLRVLAEQQVTPVEAHPDSRKSARVYGVRHPALAELRRRLVSGRCHRAKGSPWKKQLLDIF